MDPRAAGPKIDSGTTSAYDIRVTDGKDLSKKARKTTAGGQPADR